MSGYQPFATLRAHIVSGPPAMPVVDRALVRPEPKPAHSRRSLSAETVAEIIRLRSEHKSLRFIREQLNVSAPSVLKYTAHIAPPEGGWPSCWQTGARPRLDARKAFAQRLRRSGFTYGEIAEEIGCCRSQAVIIVRGPRQRGKISAVSPAVQIVARVSGISCALLRRGEFDLGCKTRGEVAKARAILFWILRQKPSCLSFPRMGKSLGGFDHTTCLHGFRRAEQAAETFGITPHRQIARSARRLWQAEWPNMAGRA